MQDKRWRFDSSILILILLILFVGANNYLWLRMNQRPPVDDEAMHLLSSLQYLHIISHPSPDMLQKLLTVDKLYPPLFTLFGAFFALILGKSIMLFCMLNALFMAGIFFCMYLIGRELQDKRAGILASCLLALYPMFFHLSRMFMVGIALCFMVVVTILFLIYTRGFSNRRMSVAAGILLGLGLLTKQTYIVFIIGPAILVFIMAFLKKGAEERRQSIVNFALFFLIGIIIALPWYLANFKVKYAALSYAAFDNSLTPFDIQVFSPRSFFFYLKKLSRDQISGFFYIVFLFSLLLRFRKIKGKSLFLTWIIVPYFILTLFPNKYYYYTMPYFAAVAFISAFGILSIGNGILRRATVIIILAAGIIQFFYFSYIGNGYNRILFNTRYYPRQGNYRIDDLLSTIVKETNGHQTTVGILTIDGNEIVRNRQFHLRILENYVLTNVHTLGFYCSFRGLPFNFINLRYSDGTIEKAKDIGFIISPGSLEDMDAPNFLKEHYSLIDVFTMPDFTNAYLYKAGSPALKDRKLETHIWGVYATELTNGDLKLILLQNKWRVFWKDKEITNDLSIYTSFRSRGVWYDSTRFTWKLREVSDTRVVAVGYCPTMPVYQVWIFQLGEGRIDWRVVMYIDGYLLPLEREQANIMLEARYAAWRTQGESGLFPKHFNQDYNGDWQRLVEIKPGKENYVGALGQDSGLADVLFFCPDPRPKLEGGVVNSDDHFNGRVLQYVVKHPQFYYRPSSVYEYFNGFFIIGDREKSTQSAP